MERLAELPARGHSDSGARGVPVHPHEGQKRRSAPVGVRSHPLRWMRRDPQPLRSGVCVCVCVFIKLHVTAQSGPVILVI